MHSRKGIIAALVGLTLGLGGCGDEASTTEPGVEADVGDDGDLDGAGDVLVDGDGGGVDVPRDTRADADVAPMDTGADADADVDAEPDTPQCPLGELCNPIVIAALPFSDARDTTRATSSQLDGYSCAPDTDESGPEFVYSVTLETSGTLTVSVDDATDGVDIDVHILDGPNAGACLARGNTQAEVQVDPGTYLIVTDTWVNSSGDAMPGPYTLSVSFRALEQGACNVETEPLAMVWSSCHASLDCFEAPDADGQTRRWLQLPATGPVVKEAHLVTVDDDFGGGWPSSFTEGINAHYTLSEAASGYATDRSEPWAPAGEGGSEFGQGSTGGPIPVIDEAWYINMYWRQRPDRGTRMIVRNAANGRAVVASAGYETGPGSNTAVAGVAEEIHDYLGTGHRDALQVGFAVDQALPLGPITCP